LALTVAGGIFLAGNEGFGVEETPVWTVPNLIDDIGFKVDVEGTGHVFARGRLREECAEATIVGRRRTLEKTTVGLHTMDQNDQHYMKDTRYYSH